MATVYPQAVLSKDDGTTYELSALASGAAAGIGPATGAATSVNSVTTAGGVSILAANAARRGAIITNTDANPLYLYFGANGTVSTSVFHAKVATDASLVLDPGDYTGHISGIWSADGSGAAKVAEFTS